MSETRKDPFEESSWGSLRYNDASGRIVGRALHIMNSLGIMFGKEQPASPRLEFVPGGELPVLGRFNTPLGSAEVRLLWHFETSTHPNAPDSLHGTIVVFVQAPCSIESKWRQADWRVEVSQYDDITALSGGHERLLFGPRVGPYVDMDIYRSSMALYRAIIEVK